MARTSAQPAQPAQSEQRAPRGRRRHPLRKTIIVLVVLLGLATAADFVTRAYAENAIAVQMQRHGFPVKPQVSIDGFPFLTQLAARDVGKVTISATNVPVGPVRFATMTATLHNVKITPGYNGATISSLTAVGHITFAGFSSALSDRVGALASVLHGTALVITPISPDEVRGSIRLTIFSATATWKVTRLNSHEMNARLVASSGLPSALLGPVSDVSFPMPRLPVGLELQRIVVNSGGLVATLTGHDVTLR